MNERKVFCARWPFCEALAQEAVVVVVYVEVVVEVVLGAVFFPVCRMQGGGMESGKSHSFKVQRGDSSAISNPKPCSKHNTLR